MTVGKTSIEWTDFSINPLRASLGTGRGHYCGSTPVPLDPEKARARRRRYNERTKVAKYGPAAAGKDMRGRHGNHARASANGKWAGARLITSHGYVAVRVDPQHPHAWGPPGLNDFRYAYEHVLVMMRRLGRPLCSWEVVHHKNGDKQDNRDENLELLTASEHMREHAHDRVRDERGRFL